MPTKCLITGLIVTPDGNPLLSQKVYFVSRKVRPITPLTIVPEHAIGETDAQGMISIELYPGPYTGQVMIGLKQKYPTFEITVPDAPFAVLSDLIDLPPPETLDAAGQALAGAREARDQAWLAVESVQDGASAYQLAVDEGFEGTLEEWLATLKGNSAYALALADGFVGTLSEWLEFLQGDKGDKGDKGDQGDSMTLTVLANKAEFDAYIPNPNGTEWVVLYV